MSMQLLDGVVWPTQVFEGGTRKGRARESSWMVENGMIGKTVTSYEPWLVGTHTSNGNL